MTCPYLEYRKRAEEPDSTDARFEIERGYCTATEEFVQPMRADICNDRYDLDHERHCEIYREHEESDATAGDTR